MDVRNMKILREQLETAYADWAFAKEKGDRKKMYAIRKGANDEILTYSENGADAYECMLSGFNVKEWQSRFNAEKRFWHEYNTYKARKNQ